jgi:hypothetical protein
MDVLCGPMHRTMIISVRHNPTACQLRTPMMLPGPKERPRTIHQLKATTIWTLTLLVWITQSLSKKSLRFLFTLPKATSILLQSQPETMRRRHHLITILLRCQLPRPSDMLNAMWLLYGNCSSATTLSSRPSALHNVTMYLLKRRKLGYLQLFALPIRPSNPITLLAKSVWLQTGIPQSLLFRLTWSLSLHLS